MIKEGLILVADDIEDIVDTTLKMADCPLEECFPVGANKFIDIDGKTYQMFVNVELKEFKK